MSIEIIKMSSKGQVVIPNDIRRELDADEGSLFAVMRSKDAVILKKIQTPSKEKLLQDLEKIAKEAKERLHSKGIKESDIQSIVERARKR